MLAKLRSGYWISSKKIFLRQIFLYKFFFATYNFLCSFSDVDAIRMRKLNRFNFHFLFSFAFVQNDRYAGRSVRYIRRIPQSMWTVYCAKMLVYRSLKHSKNAVASIVHAGWRVNGRYACKRIAKAETWLSRIGMCSAYIQMARKPIRAISPNDPWHARSAIMNDANRIGAWINGIM